VPSPEPVVVHERDRPEEEWPGIVRWRTLLGGADDPAVGMTVGFATIDPGSSTDGAPHRHAPAEVYLFRSGRGVVQVGDREIPVEPGSVVVVPGGARHFVHNPGDEPLCFHYVFGVDRFADVVYEFD
jgi:mannose-6-phosphate isomerase-like protein (cupin superfamily)